ncbi:cubilin homolog [Condylostylus longicornis]|uniref:cubilin homolog n=1 Tax=Condylostylus longicornis TaxID=2530218 RepID=UPI00244E03C4|nr:cubilin homolog [Condylostylus longicornis]
MSVNKVRSGTWNAYGRFFLELKISTPKIISRNGNLILESARDKNITLRVVGNGRILINNVDISTNKIVKPPVNTLDFNNNQQNSWNFNDEDEIKKVLNTFALNITKLSNITTQQKLQLRRLQTRVSRINRDFLNLINNLKANKCVDGPCKNGGTCIPIYNSFLCQCSAAWQGVTCETDVDECSQFLKTPNLGCQNDAWCENTPGGYNCRCKSGYFGVHCTEKERDCLKGSTHELCGNGVCLNTKNGIECLCDQGWKKHEVTGACTVDINECEADINPCHSTCINVPGKFYCGPCPNGFSGNGFVCSDINECDINNGGCSQLAKCVNTFGSFHCGMCPPGYYGDGRTCELSETNSCDSLGYCSPHANCRIISGVPICTCKIGYEGNGQICIATIPESNPCASNPCAPNERCERLLNSGYKCVSYSLCLNNPCKNGGTCIEKGQTFECACAQGFKGRTCLTIDNGMCNKVIVDDTGTLDLMNYPPDSNCYYILQTTLDKILNVTFNKFNLNNSTDCSRNFLQLHNGKNSAAPGFGRYCGTLFPMNGQFYTSHNFLYIWFKTDSSPSNPTLGFQLSWESVNPVCGGQFTFENNLKLAGTISSPGWPSMSPPNRDCSWNFLAPNGKKLAFRIIEIKLSGTETNCGDYIEIRNGDDSTKLCSSSITPSVYETTSNSAEINFHSDQYSSDSAFQIHYEITEGIPNCGGIFDKTHGSLQSPKTEDPTLKAISCQYLIRQPVGTRVLLEFETFEIPGLYNCSIASLEIYDGSNENAPLLMRRCYSDTFEPIKSSGNNLMLRYKYIDGFPHSVYNGFKANYKLLCDKQLKNSSEAFTSPGFPNPYPSGITCTYEIQAPVNHIIALSTEEFSLSAGKFQSCAVWDNVEIFTSTSNSSRFCDGPTEILLSKNNYMKIIFNSLNNFNKAKGFKFRYQFENTGCGGVLTELNGTISTINSRMSDYFCEWIIKAPPDYSISLKYKRINYNNLNYSNCDKQLFQFQNFSSGETLKTEICKLSQAKDFTSFANTVTLIQIISKDLSYDEGFEVDYVISDTECGGTIVGAYGEIKSPAYPKEYPNSMDCTWLIVAPDGHQIEIKPLNFSLEMLSETCGEDYLEIRNGKSDDSPLIGKFCGKKIPSRIPSQANFLLLRFHSDYSIRHQGFFLTYAQTATGCGGNIDSFEGSIHSPHYPDITQNGALCNWLITVSAGSKITAEIVMDINDPDDCDKNKLIIYDGGSVKYNKIAIGCKNDTLENKSLTQTIYSTSNKLFIRFETSSDEPARFLLTYKTNCTSILTDLQGQVESPNFPNNYPRNSMCIWTIVSKKSKSITMVVSHLQLEGTLADCYYDRLIITELKNNETLKTYELCKEKSKTIVSDGDSIRIKFFSDYSNSAKGFRIEYNIETCGGYLKSQRGLIQSFNSPYSNNIYCMWTIEADYGNVVQLNVSANYGLENCDWINEGLLISNDKTGSDIITKTCGAKNFKVVSHGRLMYIYFMTNEFHKQKYFRASYNIHKQTCGGNVLVETDVIHLRSPNFPLKYDPNTDCEWSVTSTFNKRFQINVLFTDIEESILCAKDYLELFNSNDQNENTLIWKYCGNNIPILSQFNSTTHKMVIKFHSDNSTEKAGFNIAIKRLCGANIEGATRGLLTKKLDEDNCEWKLKTSNNVSFKGQFASPQYPYPYKPGFECETTIKVSKGNIIQIVFSKFDLVSSDHCNEDYVEIREGAVNGKFVAVLCGNDIVNKTYELYELAWLKFKSSSTSVGGAGFLAHYEYKRDVEIFTEQVGSKGTIINPPLENVNEEVDPFSWRIITDLGKVLVFDFKEYSQGLQFYDGFDGTAGEKKISHSPLTLISTSNFAYIVAENSKLHQFLIEWRSVEKDEIAENKTKCGDIIEIPQNVEKNFSSPNYPNPYESNQNCEWIFKPKMHTDHVALALHAADLEVTPDCYADYLKIFSGEDLSIWIEEKVACNLTFKSTPYFVVHGKPFLKLVLRSDVYSEGPGFTSIVTSKCGGILTESAGFLDWNAMLGDVTCAWKIKVQRGRKIEFKFDFSFETLFYNSGNDKCEDAYAVIRNGIDEDGPIMQPGRICSNANLEFANLTTISNTAYVKFQRKPNLKIPWKLSYREHNECGDEIHLNLEVNSTTIESPNYPQMPHPYAECTWTFTSPPATTINVQFTEFVTHGNRINCIDEYIQIRDGSTNLAPQIGRYCRKPTKSIVAQSSSNKLLIKYFANTSEPLDIFIASVSIAKCFTLVEGFYFGEIKSLNYPAKGGYIPNSECIYTIQTGNFFRVNITIVDLDLPFNSSNLNKSDHLEISADDNVSKQVVLLYGNDTRKFLELFGNIRITFFTYNAQTQYRGFKLTYKRQSACFQNIHAEEGDLTARKSFRKFFNCRWQITVPKGRIVRAKITELQLTSQTRYSNHKIRFFNDFSGKSKIIEMTNATADFVNSTDNRMLIRLDGGYPSIVSSIKISFDSYGMSNCIPDFNLSANVLQTHYVSVSNLPTKYFCLSNIMLKDGETIGFRLNNLLLLESNGTGAPISIKTAFTNYKTFMENITNYDIALSRKSATLEFHNSGEYKIFNFEISVMKHQCGAEYVNYGQTYLFTLPINVSSNYGRIDCAWTFNFKYYFTNKNLTFVSNFEFTDCTKEYLAIYNGELPSDILITKLCGNNSFNFVPDGNYLLAHYHSENFTGKSKLNVSQSWKKECGRDIIPTLRGALISFEAKDYENNLECIWTYRAKDGFSVALQFFGRFFIPSNPNCTDDYLEIKRLSIDNKWIQYPKFCGRESPVTINSTSSVYEIKFRSDDKIVGDGFNIKFIDFCGGVYNVTENIQTIKSPVDWYTSRYQIKCNYTLVTDSNNIIVAKFSKFKVGSDASGRDCYYSKLSVYYEKDYSQKKIGVYCQTNPLKNEIRTKKYITLIYEGQLYTDDFSFDFYIESCGGNVTKPTRIHSPMDENGIGYPAQMDCIWLVTAPPNKDIQIQFSYIYYENNYKCMDDYIAIYNSTEAIDSFRKLLLCGNHTGSSIPITKTSGNALIVTKSDSYMSFKGFAADISFIPKCDKFLNLTVEKSSHIEFDYYFMNGNYESNLFCQIYFTTSPDFQILIEFMDFDVKDCAQTQNSNLTLDIERCKCDYLEVFDGPNTYQKSLGKFCGNSSPKIIQSSKQYLTLKFITDNSIAGTGFKYEVKRKANICSTRNIDLYDKKEYIVTSPNYPEYPPNTYCEWRINTNSSFQIKFDKFDLEDVSPLTGICNDYLEIIRPYTVSQGNIEQDIVYCSNKIPANVNVYASEYTMEKTKLIFKSNSEIQKSGFKLIIKEKGVCNMTLIEASGYVEYAVKGKCRFNVEIEDSKTMALYFDIRSLNTVTKNCSQTIKMFDTKSNELLHQICVKETYYSSYQVFLKSSKVTIEAERLNADGDFDVDFFYMGNSNGLGCGGEFHGIKGVLSSPMYPSNFRNYSECRWVITGPTNTVIGIYFKDFDMGSKKNCPYDNLQIIEASPIRSKVALELCGGDDPGYFDSKTNEIIILYKRTVNFDGRGWLLGFEAKAEYKSGTIIT